MIPFILKIMKLELGQKFSTQLAYVYQYRLMHAKLKYKEAAW